MDVKAEIENFQDHLAPKLDTYEQAIYLYVFRHSRLQGKQDITIGFKSARRKIALGIGEERPRAIGGVGAAGGVAKKRKPTVRSVIRSGCA